jgi:hypothetical protein
LLLYDALPAPSGFLQDHPRALDAVLLSFSFR